MAFNSNTVAGTVVHTTNEFNTRLIVPNDVSLVSSTDYQSLLKLSLGKYERAIFRIWLDLALDADGDFKYKIILAVTYMKVLITVTVQFSYIGLH